MNLHIFQHSRYEVERLWGDANDRRDACEPSLTLDIDFAHPASKNYLSTGGQSILGGRSGHSMPAYYVHLAGKLLKDVGEEEEVSTDVIRELRQAADLSLCATKETAKSIGRSMAALVPSWVPPC